ncbi:16S rRNA (guanine(527)-N(7))-methyltransferase RsmG [Halodurantibacterium flavum]|uniref:Ribosomal RNA small subunit methyltransferase G n=1 Tax=Halodurantibacterium flavum TaxID=1382802 RepID=A0ABW4S8B2_9RHOB
MRPAQAFLNDVDVSRETIERLEAFEALLRRWNAAINLVSKTTLDDVWTRHFLDSAQVAALSSSASHWADLGSGGGFPGLVVAVIYKEKSPETRFSLVESDARKSAFLATVIRDLDLKAQVIAKRIEATEPLRADVVSARALAPLATLCGYAARHLADGGRAVFLKGANHREEIAEARKLWQFECQLHPSVSDPTGVILCIENIQHV